MNSAEREMLAAMVSVCPLRGRVVFAKAQVKRRGTLSDVVERLSHLKRLMRLRLVQEFRRSYGMLEILEAKIVFRNNKLLLLLKCGKLRAERFALLYVAEKLE